MPTTVPAGVPFAPQGPIPYITDSESWDYPRLVYVAPYFTTVPLAELIAPAVTEATEAQLPTLVPPYVNQAAIDAVNQNAVLLTGSTMNGPLYLAPLMPTQDSQAASKAYVDSMIASGGVPEVPAVPLGQTWGRQTGQWIAIQPGNFLPLTGGTMTGAIQMGGSRIDNLAALPQIPNGAAPAQWVLNQIAAQSLYQGVWNMDTYTPDLTLPATHQNEFMFIASTVSATGIVVGPAIPGLQGLTVFNGDEVIYSTIAGGFEVIHGGQMTKPEADALYVPFGGGTMSGPLILSRDPVNVLEAATRQWVLAQVATAGIAEAPNDGQIYGRSGVTTSWTPVLALGGGILTGPLTLHANAIQPFQATTLQQVSNMVSGYVPVTGGVTITGPITMGVAATLLLNGNATSALQAVPLQQLQTIRGSATVSDTAPATPSNGQLWFDSVAAQLYVSYNDGTSTQWVRANT